LVEKVAKRDYHLSTGFIGTKYLMLALSKIGRPDLAYRLLHNNTFPSWGFSIKHGATSIWERWDGWTPEKGFQDPGMNSFAHYSFGAVYQWMFGNIGGINTKGPAFKQIVIAPQLDEKLTWANVDYRSVQGLVASHWKRTGKGVVFDLIIPVNATAEVTLPPCSLEGVKESGHPVGKAEGVKFLSMRGANPVLAVESGHYSFEVPMANVK